MARVELVAGVAHDPLFGSLVMVGLGGVHTDLFGDPCSGWGDGSRRLDGCGGHCAPRRC